MSQRTEVPASSEITKINVRSEESAASVKRNCGIFHMHMIDSVHKVLKEQMRRNALPDQMAGVEVQTKLRSVRKLLEQPLGRIVIKCDLTRMDLKRKYTIVLHKFIQDRTPQIIDLLESVFDHLFRCLREGVQIFPNRRSHKTSEDLHPKFFRNCRCLFHSADSPCTDLVLLSCQFRRCEIIKSRIIIVAHTLTDHMGGDRLALKVVFFQRILDLLNIGIIFIRPVNIEMVAPAGDLQPVISHLLSSRADLFKRHICPLSCN